MLGKDLRISLGYAVSLFLFVGCASPQKAIYLAPAFEEVNIDTITILPIVDSRTQRKFEINESKLQQIVYPVIESGLNEKGYTLEYGNNTGGIQCLKFGRSTNIETECLQSVGAQNSKWILVLSLEDLQMRTPYGGEVTAKMAGILFDRKKGKMLWRDLEYAGLSQRQLVWQNMNALIVNDVIEICTLKLISSLPVKSSPPRRESSPLIPPLHEGMTLAVPYHHLGSIVHCLSIQSDPSPNISTKIPRQVWKRIAEFWKEAIQSKLELITDINQNEIKNQYRKLFLENIIYILSHGAI